MRKLLIGSSALVLAAGGFVVPKALAGTSGSSSPTACGDVSLTLSKTVLWPPNHKMIPIIITASESNDTDMDSTTVTVSMITNNDETGTNGAEINGTGKPDVAASDESGTGNSTKISDGETGTIPIALAAERSGHDTTSGRTYTIDMTCNSSDLTEGTMGMSTAQLFVNVPHDQGQK